jgi:SH3 domain protein
MSTRKITAVVALFLLLPLLARAETAYVTDKLYAGLRPQPDKETVPLKTVSTGAVLEVLGRQGNFARVRDAEGVEGWIDNSVLATEPPARLQLDNLKKQQDSLKAQLDKTSAALSQETARAADLAKKLAEKTGDAEKAAEQIAAHEAALQAADQAAGENTAQPAADPETPPVSVAQETGSSGWFSLGWMAFSFAMLVVGFFAGVVWLRESNRRKMGGMYLRI